MADAKKELKELLHALGLIGGEIHEVTKDGFGVEDLQSLIELANNFDKLKEGFSFEGLNKDDLKELKQEDLVEILMAAFSGFSEGKK